MTIRARLFGICALSVASSGLLTGTSRAGLVLDQHAVTSATNLSYSVDTTDSTFHTAIGTSLNNSGIPANTPVVTIKTDIQLDVQGQGQADIVNRNANEAFGSITVTPISPYNGFFVIGLNPQGAGLLTNQTTITLTVQAFLDGSSTPTTPDGGISSFSFSNSGQNFIRATATNGDYISKLVLTINPADSQMLKQFRVDLDTNLSVVPEPSTIVMVVSSALPIGFMALRRVRRSSATSVA